MGERHKGTQIYRDLDHDHNRDRNSRGNEPRISRMNTDSNNGGRVFLPAL